MKNFDLSKKLFAGFCFNYNSIFGSLKPIFFIAGLILVGFTQFGFGQYCENSKSQGCENGIGVSNPKIYDNRSLVIMLEELNRTLQTIKVVDQTSLLANLGLTQGSTSREVSRSFQAGMTPIPGVTTTRTPDTDGNLTISEEVTTKPEVSAQTPTLPDALAAPSFTPKFGINSEDLLTQQIDLTYKIFNLRMLLERSISDRLMPSAEQIAVTADSTAFTADKDGFLIVAAPNHKLPTGSAGNFTTSEKLPGGLSTDQSYYVIRVDDNTYKIAATLQDALFGRAVKFKDRGLGSHTFTTLTDGQQDGARLQTVVGFNVSLDPPKNNKDMAAFVELTVTANGKPISVVAMMPQEKTYNTSALSTKSNAFGGSAVVKMFTVGYSERRRGQTFYLYQDADTLTYQRIPAEVEDGTNISNANTTFGWAFRPVLGRRSVSPGMRQVFAVLSIDRRDLVDVSESTKLDVQVKTFWRKYSRKTLTVYDEPVNQRSFNYLGTPVFSTAKYQAGLSPRVQNVRWNQLDDKNGVLSIDGENFFSGTSVLVGNNTLDNPANGLTIKSDQSLQVRTSLDAFATGEVVLNGRYGNAESVVGRNKSSNASGIAFDNLSSEALSDKTTRIKITLRNKNLPTNNRTREESQNSKTELQNVAKGQLKVADITGQEMPPVVLINNSAFLVRNSLQDVDCQEIVFFEWFDPQELVGKTPAQEEQIINSHKFTYKKSCVMAIVDIPSALVKESAFISFRIPLLGDDWKVTRTLYFEEPPSGLKLTKIGANQGQNFFSITGKKLKDLILLPPSSQIVSFTYQDDSLITFDLSDKQLETVKTLILKTPAGQAIVVALPGPPVTAFTITSVDPQQIFANSSKTVTFKGEGLAGVKEVLFEGKTLQIIKKSEKEITVLLTRDVTKEAGEIEIIFKKDESTMITGKVTILEVKKESKP